jgi:hypothetical protein
MVAMRAFCFMLIKDRILFLCIMRVGEFMCEMKVG